MLTRPTRRNQNKLRDRFRSHLWRLTATAFASSVAVTTLAPNAIAADGIILEAPANQPVDVSPVSEQPTQGKPVTADPPVKTKESTKSIDAGWSKRGVTVNEDASRKNEATKSEKSFQSDSSRAEATIAALPKGDANVTVPPLEAPEQIKRKSTDGEANTSPNSAKVPARQVAGPVDGFKARTKLPSLKVAEKETPALEFVAPTIDAPKNVPAVAGDMQPSDIASDDDTSEKKTLQTPGAMALEQLRSVPPPVTGNWRGRGTSVGDQPVHPTESRQLQRMPEQAGASRRDLGPQQGTQSVAPQAPGPQTRAPQSLGTGGWVAREAINRIAPLRDPVPQSPLPAKAAQPLTTTPGPAASRPRSGSDVDAPTKAPAVRKAPAEATNVREDVSPIAKPNASPKAQPRQSSQAIDTRREIPSMNPSLDELPTEADLPLASEKLSPEKRSMSLDEAARHSDRSQRDQKETQRAEEEVQRDQKEAMAEKLLDSIGSAATVKRGSLPEETDDHVVAKKSSPAKLRAFDGDAAELQPLPKGDLEELPKGKRIPPKQKMGGATSSVGDLPPQENADSIDQPELDIPDEVELDYTGRPAAEITPNRSVANMRVPIERVLRYFYLRPEIASGRSNWGMMHQLIVFGTDTQIRVGNRQYSAIAWIAGNNICRGQRLLTNDADGIKAKNGVGLQGHDSQFLAVLGMCNVPVEYPLYAGKMKYTVDALIKSEQRGCKEDNELTFTLMGLSHYLDTDSKWMSDDGTQWDFERLIAEELDQQIVGAACGGTHRLMGYAHALRKRRAEGKPIDGHWKRAEIYTQDFIDYAYSLQNRDGSMSTNWFEGRADNGDVDRKIQTTGHIVEWLLTVTPDEELQDRRLVAAVNYLLRAMSSDLDHDWSIGPKGHALRSLAMYHQRVFRSGTPWVPQQTASVPAQRYRR
ncbi:hypothetical protein U8335_18430 [Roseiconus lacunae]|uniref:hypothetical protein n=1 Tax=Roseiconus lacunae TaxID=2605694 RepID=UPI00308BAE39|nr:hypothetical protein U8335_18430 [Stieleria sp. HD01]